MAKTHWVESLRLNAHTTKIQKIKIKIIGERWEIGHLNVLVSKFPQIYRDISLQNQMSIKRDHKYIFKAETQKYVVEDLAHSRNKI